MTKQPKQPRVIDISAYANPSDVDDDSDAAFWRTYKNYKKARKIARAEEDMILLPRLGTKGKLVRYSEYHYGFQPTNSQEVYDLWPTSGKWRERNRHTTHGGGVGSLLRYLEKKGKQNG